VGEAVNEFLDFILLFLSQFSGGPSAPENNLVRFGLATIFWGVLLIFAFFRQRHENHPREKLLIYGFGLGFFRGLIMVIHASIRILFPAQYQVTCTIIEPIEHAMMLAMVVVVSGAFLRYILDDAQLAKRFLQVGLAVVALEFLVILAWWPRQLANNTNLQFHKSWSAAIMHLIACAVIIVAIIILVRQRGWLRNVIVLALSSFLLSEFLILLNITSDFNYNSILCPIANTFYIWAIPLFGYVYFHEQSIEKQRSQAALQAHRDHLEEIVAARTSELILANKQLEKAAVLEERQRIAAEMHDGLAQTLTYLGMKTDVASELAQNEQSDQLVCEFGEMRQVIDQATHDVRRAITSLTAIPQSRRSLQDVLIDLVNERNEVSEPIIRLIDKLVTPLVLIPAELEQVSRVINEALLNAARHAQATDIFVEIGARSDKVVIIIADNGRGFDPTGEKVAKKDHFGLNIMQARAARLGGQLAIKSGIDQGTQVSLTWQPTVDLGAGERTKQLTDQKYQPTVWIPAV